MSNFKQSGFTLLETLIVISLIGIILGFISLSPQLVNNEAKLEQEQLRLYHLLNLLADRAILENQPYGLRIHQQQYHFFRYEPELVVWFDLAEDKVLYTRQFADNLHWQLEQNNQILSSTSDIPSLIFFPDGQHQGFIATLSLNAVKPSSKFHIKGDGIALSLQP